MNYLEEALRTPDRFSLALFSTRPMAERSFRNCLTGPKKEPGLRMVANNLEIRFEQGGRLVFGVLAHDHDVWRYRGTEWENVFMDDVHGSKLVAYANAYLHRPVYNGYRNGV